MLAPAATENEIQRAVFQHLRTRAAPGVFAFHPKNGGVHQRRRVQRGVNSGMGVVSGVPDVIVIFGGNVYAIELKKDNAPPPSAEQIRAIERIRDAGGHACVCYGLDRALACLEAWGILKGTAA